MASISISERFIIKPKDGDCFGGATPESYKKNWPQYILKLENVYLGPEGAIFDSDKNIILEANFNYIFWKNLSDDLKRPDHPMQVRNDIHKQKLSATKITKLKEGINYIYGHQYFNHYVYGHLWDTFQDLEKIESLNLASKKLITPPLHGPVKDIELHFKLFGFEQKDIEQLDLHRKFSNHAYHVPVLYYPSCTAYPSLMSARGVDYLRKKYFKLKTSETPEVKLYLARKTAQRPVINEEQVIANLKNQGFKILFGNEGLKSHIQHFSNASIIVGAHGAMIKNFLFCKKGTKIIEFFAEDYVNTCYKSMKDIMGLDYTSVELPCDSALNISIPIDKLNNLI